MISKTLRIMAVATAAALALAACGSKSEAPAGGESATALANVPAPAGKTWSQVVVATNDGFLMGNPEAPLKVIEFASPTCSHCADFSTHSAEALPKEFVDTGRVSVELRPFMLNPMDVVISSIAACGGPDRFFPLMKNIYATQRDLVTAIQSADQNAMQAALQKPEGERMSAFAAAANIKPFFEARGVSEADINRCLADSAAVNKWAESTQRNGQQFEVSGTPTFILNGENIGSMTWDQLKAKLQAAGAR